MFLQMCDLYLFGLTVFTIAIYNSSTLGLIYQMYCDHYMAFRGHIKSQMVLFISTEITLVALAGIQGWLSMINTCLSDKEEIVGSIFRPTGICSSILPSNFEKRYFALSYLAVEFSLLLQIMAFFLFNKPHDCYRCLGKDPERIYSRFQLSKEQVARRVVRARFSREEELRVS